MNTFRINRINTAYFNGLVIGRNAPGGVKATFQTGNGDTVDSLAGQISRLSAQVAALCAQVDAMCGLPVAADLVGGGARTDS